MSSKTIIFDPDGDLTLVFPEPALKETKLTFPQLDENAPDSMYPEYFKKRGLTPKSQKIQQGKSEGIQEIRMLVSSKVLALASPVFRSMFSPAYGFRESSMLRAEDAEIYLPDEHPETFEILLYALHGKNHALPLLLPAEYLLPMAISIDKYGVHEAMAFCIKSWMHSRVEWDLLVSGVEHPQLIAITWVFNDACLFEQFTRHIICGEQQIQDSMFLDLPIPQRVIDALKARQQFVIKRHWEILQSMLTDKTPQGCYQRIRRYVGMAWGNLNPDELAFINNTFLNLAEDFGLTQRPHKFVSYPEFKAQVEKLNTMAENVFRNEKRILKGKIEPVMRFLIHRFRQDDWRGLDIEKYRGRLSQNLMRLSDQGYDGTK